MNNITNSLIESALNYNKGIHNTEDLLDVMLNKPNLERMNEILDKISEKPVTGREPEGIFVIEKHEPSGPINITAKIPKIMGCDFETQDDHKQPA